MFCLNCGAKLPDEAVFCFKCGKKIVLTETEVKPNETKDSEGKAVTGEPTKSAEEKVTTDETKVPEPPKQDEPSIIPHTVLIERAIEDCGDVIKKNRGCHLKGNIDQALFERAMKKYGGTHNIQLEDVYLLYDDTIFGSGTVGFMITSTCILTSRKNEISFFNLRHISCSSYDLMVTDQYGKEYELFSPTVDRKGLEGLFQNIDVKLPEIKKSMEYLMNLSKESTEKAKEWLDKATKNAVQLYETQKEQKIQELTERFNAWFAGRGQEFTFEQKTEFLEIIRKDPFKAEKNLEFLMLTDNIVKQYDEEKKLPKANTTQMAKQVQQRKVYEDLKIGDIIEFGEWNDLSIEWQVIAFEEDWVMLLSKEALDYQIYDELPGARWKESSLYRWCNNEFYKWAFTSEEKKAIANITIDDEDIGCVHILNDDEVKEYLPRARDRVCLPSDALEQVVQYDEEHIVEAYGDDSDYVTWWIMHNDEASEGKYYDVVDKSGIINTRKYTEEAFVRPTIWVNVNWLQGKE